MTEPSSATMIAMAQNRLQQYQPKNNKDKTATMLRALLDNSPIAPTKLCEAIVAADTDAELVKLGDWYFNGLLVPIRAAGRRTPWATAHPSTNSPDEASDRNAAELRHTARDQARLKKEVAERDGYRCVFTGWHSDNHPDAANLPATYPTVAAHIIPYCWVGGKGLDIPMIWTVVERYAGIKLVELNGKKINEARNALTATEHAHTRFGNLEIWLEAIPGRENSYHFRKAQPRYLASTEDGKEIIFSVPPFPEPRFLALHAICARVLHLTAMAEEIDKFLEDFESMKVLSQDGSSAQLLASALSMVPLAVN